jgi:signal transduction histidine kinase
MIAAVLGTLGGDGRTIARDTRKKYRGVARMRAFEDVSLAIEGAVARITVTRPGRLNAMRDQTADEVRAALAGHSATVLRERSAAEMADWRAALSRAYAIRVHHARPVIADGKVIGVVMVTRSPRGLFIGIWQDRFASLLGAGLIFLTLLVLAGLLSRGIARPIMALARASEEVARGVPVVPETPVTAAIEIAQLYDNFRAMAERIERRQRYLRDVAAAVAHEFKTPIAGIRGALELLDEHGGTMRAEERQRFLGNAAADADRLARLVQRLLDLARADMTTIEAGAQADVVAAARRVADSLPRSNSSSDGENCHVAWRSAEALKKSLSADFKSDSSFFASGFTPTACDGRTCGMAGASGTPAMKTFNKSSPCVPVE